jgi:hypothetical protein
LFVGTYNSNPNTGTQTAAGGLLIQTGANTANPVTPNGFFDVHVRGASAADTAVVTFSYSGDINVTPVVGFFLPGQGWQQLRSSSLVTDTFTVDPITHIILKGEYQGISYAGKILDPTTLLVVDKAAHTLTAFFDSTSNPQVTQLHGTVFTVAVPVSQTTTTTVNPDVASAGNTAGLASTTTFVSSSQVTLVLNVSQANQGTATQSEVAAPNRAGQDEADQDDDFLKWLWGDGAKSSEQRQPQNKGKVKDAVHDDKEAARTEASKEKTETRSDGESQGRKEGRPN